MSRPQFPPLAATAAMVLVLAACAPLQPAAPGPAAATTSPAGVTTKTEQGGRYLVVIGPRQQHAEPFFGIADTNYYALRSLIDRTTGQTSQQLFVEDSYVGPERHWDAAHDGWGQTLRFTPISHNKLACESGKCSYADEFAAAIPEPELRGSPRGMEVTFTDKAGDTKTIKVPGHLIAIQLAAFDAARGKPAASPPPTATAPPTGGMPPPSAFSSATPPTSSPPRARSPSAPTGGMPPPSAFSSAAPPASAADAQTGERPAWPRHRRHRHGRRKTPASAATVLRAPVRGGPGGNGKPYVESWSSLPQPAPTEPLAQPEAPALSGTATAGGAPGAGSPLPLPSTPATRP
jgi:hypothetical protein